MRFMLAWVWQRETFSYKKDIAFSNGEKLGEIITEEGYEDEGVKDEIIEDNLRKDYCTRVGFLKI